MTLELKRIIEAMLFAAERPLTTREMRSIFAEATDEEQPGVAEAFRNVREAQIVAVLEELKIELETQPRASNSSKSPAGGGW